MTVLSWDGTGERLYETGVDRGVLYIPNNGIYDTGYAWNGLTAVTESPSGAEPTALYADNIKYLTLMSAEDYGITIEAYTSPVQFALCDGTAQVSAGVFVGQQPRKAFGFSWRTRIGNDVSASDFGYKLHLVWGAMASPSEKAFETINDTPDAITLSWEVSTTPVAATGFKPVASMTIDSTKVLPAALSQLENALYGTAGSSPRLPSPDEVVAIFTGSAPTSVTPTAPTATAAGVITIPTVPGVVYRRTDTNAPVTGTVTIPEVGQTLGIRAQPLSGYVFPDVAANYWSFTKTA